MKWLDANKYYILLIIELIALAISLLYLMDGIRDLSRYYPPIKYPTMQVFYG